MYKLKIDWFNQANDTLRVSLVEGEDSRHTGKVVRGSFMSESKREAAAKELGCGVTAEMLLDAIVQFRRDGKNEIEVKEIAPPETPTEQVAVREPIRFLVRETTAPTSRGTRYESLVAALQTPGTHETLIEWGDDNRDLCCAVDLDWHHEPSRENPENLLIFASKVMPAPFVAWVTRSNGLRMIYTGAQADLRAAVAAVRAVERFPSASGVELKSQTRHPGGSPVRYANEDYDLACVWPRGNGSDGEVDAEAWAAWLRGHDLAMGRYSHDRCLIDPAHSSQSPSPVEVRPSGIMCHSCGGRTGRGWLSAAYLLRGEETFSQVSPLTDIVRNLSHYEHAKYILHEHTPKIIPDEIMKLYYRALLIAWHGIDDVRVDSVFRDRDLIRFEGFWASISGRRRDAAKARVAISNLPACRDSTGEVIAERVELFTDCVDLDHYGYQAVQPVFGHRIGTYHPDADARRRIPRIIIPNTNLDTRPTYVASAKRMPRDEAWGVLRGVYPGIDTELIEFLIYCRGVIERGCTSLHPKFLFDGVSGSGKTSHPHIAAALCGDRCTDVIATSDDERLGQKIHEAMRVGSFATIDEVVKSAKKSRMDTRTFLTFILNLSPESSIHALYIGQVRFGWLPILCLTDTEYPEDVLADEQLGRRLIYRHLGTERLQWETSTRAAGLTHWADPRSAGGDIQFACDSILSGVIDTYFKGEVRDLMDVAEERGFKFLNADGHAERRKHQMRDLFVAWCAYTETGSHPREPGRRRFDANETSDLARLWSKLHDEGNACSWGRMNERSWSQATGHPYPLRGVVEPVRRGNNSVVSLGFEEQVDGKWRRVVTGGDVALRPVEGAA